MDAHRTHINAEYYQNLHDNNRAFLENNWLVDELNVIQSLVNKVETVLELGCGNGRFLEIAAKLWPEVTGVDWAKSSYIDTLLKNYSNIKFIQADVTKLKLTQSYDLVVSADFLEHLPEDILPLVIGGMLQAGQVHFHKIACYDDGHSHLSIFPPEKWVTLFQSQPGGENTRIVQQEIRKGNPKNIVITLSNVPQK